MAEVPSTVVGFEAIAPYTGTGEPIPNLAITKGVSSGDLANMTLNANGYFKFKIEVSKLKVLPCEALSFACKVKDKVNIFANFSDGNLTDKKYKAAKIGSWYGLIIPIEDVPSSSNYIYLYIHNSLSGKTITISEVKINDGYGLISQAVAKFDLKIGNVTTLEPGANATANIRWTGGKPYLDIGIPKGLTGSVGNIDASNIQMEYGNSGAGTVKEKITGLQSSLSSASSSINSINGSISSINGKISTIESNLSPYNSVVEYSNSVTANQHVSGSGSYLKVYKSGFMVTISIRTDSRVWKSGDSIGKLPANCCPKDIKNFPFVMGSADYGTFRIETNGNMSVAGVSATASKTIFTEISFFTSSK